MRTENKVQNPSGIKIHFPDNAGEYSLDDEVYVLNVFLSSGTLKGFPCSIAKKRQIESFGRIGNTKNEAIDNLITHLISMKDLQS